MTHHSKRRTHQHLIDQEAQDVLRELIPKHWVIREYRPDYGLDFTIEVFKGVPNHSTNEPEFETLGEHIFVQLKGSKSPKFGKLRLYGRYNVEKYELQVNKGDLVGQVETLRHPIEVSELLTIQRMGAALPVLLVVVDTTTSQAYFVCLNDYIDKILIPYHGDYANTAQRTIHIPTANLLTNPEIGISALRWYAKRPKLFAAFQKFIYQQVELSYAESHKHFNTMARHFASMLMRYDFWDDTEMWAIIEHYGTALKRFIETGTPEVMRFKPKDQAILKSILGEEAEDDETDHQLEYFRRKDILELWRVLTVLPRNYEEFCREWYLPTPVGLLSSYPPDVYDRSR